MYNQPPINQVLGALGRNGDNMIAHMRRGSEMVVPLDAPDAFGQTIAAFAKDIAAYNKDMRRKNEQGAKRSAETLEPFEPSPMLDIRDFIAGWRNPERVNPYTGAEEYFSIAENGGQSGKTGTVSPIGAIGTTGTWYPDGSQNLIYNARPRGGAATGFGPMGAPYATSAMPGAAPPPPRGLDRAQQVANTNAQQGLNRAMTMMAQRAQGQPQQRRFAGGVPNETRSLLESLLGNNPASRWFRQG